MRSIEYEALMKRLTELDSRLETFNARLKAQELENDTMRNKVLRKIQQRNDEETDQKAPKELKTFSPFC